VKGSWIEERRTEEERRREEKMRERLDERLEGHDLVEHELCGCEAASQHGRESREEHKKGKNVLLRSSLVGLLVSNEKKSASRGGATGSSSGSWYCCM
jgi:hypothetical protein